VLSALVYRRRTGKGQYIDLSEQEAAIPVVGYALMDQAMNGRAPERIGNRSHWYAPQGCYRCTGDADAGQDPDGQADNWLVITIHNDAEWEAFCKAADHPEWVADRRFADVLSRFDNHDELDEAITSWTRSQDHIEAMHKLQAAGVTAAAVLNPKEVLFDPHLRERGFFDRVDTGTAGVRPVPHQIGAKFSEFEIDSARPAPKLGEHNAEILGELLGMPDDEIAALHEKGVIGDTPISAVPLPVMRMFVQFPLTSYQQMGALCAVETDYREQLGIAVSGEGGPK
jgi:crotonobetainyl-CoA:carnitine CoA-transferase CaiB-like acyl-CoA transferase